MNQIYIASDHAGFELKNQLVSLLSNKYQVIDLGPEEYDKLDDYPDYAAKLAKQVLKTNTRGILICGTGQGMDRVANKFPGIDAAVCWNEFTAEVAKEHGNANVLCLGARTIDLKMAEKILRIWLKKNVKIEPKHLKRIEKIRQIEKDIQNS